MYSINNEDIQNVARQATDRTLTEEELKFVAEKLGDYVGRYEAIVQAIGELKGTP